MADQERKALNLDELFGQAKSIQVIHEKRTYELMRVEALGPRQAVQLQRMQKRSQILQTKGEDVTEEESLEIERLFGEMITMLCPSFPVDELPFLKKMRIVMYYMEQTEGKKAMETALAKLTGPKRSRR